MDTMYPMQVNRTQPIPITLRASDTSKEPSMATYPIKRFRKYLLYKVLIPKRKGGYMTGTDTTASPSLSAQKCVSQKKRFAVLFVYLKTHSQMTASLPLPNHGQQSSKHT